MHVCYIHGVYVFLHVIIQCDCVVCLIELIVEVCCRYDMFLFVSTFDACSVVSLDT